MWTVRIWRKKVLTETESIKYAAKFDRPAIVTGNHKANVLKVQEIIESYGRYKLWRISFKAHFESTIVFAKLIPHILLSKKR